MRQARPILSVLLTAAALLVLMQSYIYLRDGQMAQWLRALLAIIWGVGGLMLLFTLASNVVEQFSPRWKRRLVPILFVGPAVAIVIWYLALPAVRTLVASLYDAKGEQFVGLANYIYAFTSREMLLSFRNNFLFWLIFATLSSVIVGLVIAVMADRTNPLFEKICKAIIFMPMAISMVGASVIWRFMYEYRPAGASQIGLLNAIVVAFGGEPQAWLMQQPWNNLFLIVIMVWLQSGYAMVILSAAIKGVPVELNEAGRIDGASEVQLFFKITLPNIWGAVVTVATTIMLATLKIFDIVQSMTGGNFGTQVIANVQYTQMFRQFNYGRAAAVAIVLLLAVLPVMYYNLRQFNKRTEAF
ncbi:MAG: binding-protein-dependent transport system inner rane component [Symbiobacteriaceae bacterium]|jgi:alpha-glucoside transport system permease protein|nr:binding-protein-dependent transport system inner rane component [Symbiobacteriaceae bacterium]